MDVVGVGHGQCKSMQDPCQSLLIILTKRHGRNQLTIHSELVGTRTWAMQIALDLPSHALHNCMNDTMNDAPQPAIALADGVRSAAVPFVAAG